MPTVPFTEEITDCQTIALPSLMELEEELKWDHSEITLTSPMILFGVTHPPPSMGNPWFPRKRENTCGGVGYPPSCLPCPGHGFSSAVAWGSSSSGLAAICGPPGSGSVVTCGSPCSTSSVACSSAGSDSSVACTFAGFSSLLAYSIVLFTSLLASSVSPSTFLLAPFGVPLSSCLTVT